MGINGLGRKSIAERYDSLPDYLNKHVFPIKDTLEEYKRLEREALKKYNAAKNRKTLQQQKLDWAYLALERWRK